MKVDSVNSCSPKFLLKVQEPWPASFLILFELNHVTLTVRQFFTCNPMLISSLLHTFYNCTYFTLTQQTFLLLLVLCSEADDGGINCQQSVWSQYQLFITQERVLLLQPFCCSCMISTDSSHSVHMPSMLPEQSAEAHIQKHKFKVLKLKVLNKNWALT